MGMWGFLGAGLCIVCGAGLAILKRARRRNIPAWESNRPRKSVWINGHLSAIYVYDEGTTNTNGNVWKYNQNGKYFSHTGFNGPYVSLTEVPYENE